MLTSTSSNLQSETLFSLFLPGRTNNIHHALLTDRSLIRHRPLWCLSNFYRRPLPFWPVDQVSQWGAITKGILIIRGVSQQYHRPCLEYRKIKFVTPLTYILVNELKNYDKLKSDKRYQRDVYWIDCDLRNGRHANQWLFGLRREAERHAAFTGT